jgi:ABC-type uncharacterized transport system ATPase component
LHEGKSTGQILIKGEIITKMKKKKKGGVMKKSCFQEPMIQKSSNLHENFLTECKIKSVKVMVTGRDHNIGNYFTCGKSL